MKKTFVVGEKSFGSIHGVFTDKKHLQRLNCHRFLTYFGILNISLNIKMSEFWVSCHERLLVRLHVTHLNSFQLVKHVDLSAHLCLTSA